MNLANIEQESFVMVHRKGQEALVALLAQRLLVPHDLAVVWTLLTHINWRSGRMRVTAAFLAEQAGMKASNVRSSLARLRKQMVISKVYDRQTGEVYFLFNPWYISAGNPQRRGFAQHQFKESLELEEDAG
jgi:Tfp pilus assembly protein PilX